MRDQSSGNGSERLTWASAKLVSIEGDAAQSRQLVPDEPLIRIEVAHHHAHEIVLLACHQIAVDHLRPACNGGLESLQIFFALPFQPDRSEGVDRKPDRLSDR